MKNLFLTLAFVLTTSLSFAGSNSSVYKIDKIENMKCITVVTSCGVYGNVCGKTRADRAELAAYLDTWICG